MKFSITRVERSDDVTAMYLRLIDYFEMILSRKTLSVDEVDFYLY